MFFFQHHLMWIICFFFFSARFLISFFHVCIPLPFLSFPLARKRKQGKKRKWKTEAVWTKFIPMTAVIGKKGERAKENISVSALQLHNPSLNCSYFFFLHESPEHISCSHRLKSCRAVLLEIRERYGAQTMQDIFLRRGLQEGSFSGSYWLLSVW